MPKTFTGGIHPPDRKELAKDKPIERLPAPPELIVYLSQHIGAPAAAVVEKGDAVKKGQVIGEARGFVSALIHSPVSGKVKAVEPRPHPLGQKVTAVIIENDGGDEWLAGANEERDAAGMAAGDIREEIRQAGARDGDFGAVE